METIGRAEGLADGLGASGAESFQLAGGFLQLKVEALGFRV